MLLRRGQPLGGKGAAWALRRSASAGQQRRGRSGSARTQRHAAAVAQEAKARQAELHKLELRLGYRFTDRRLLDTALTHPSFEGAQPDAPRSRGPLEFLGDSVLFLVTTTALMDHLPESQEGALTATRQRLVRNKHLAKVAERLALHDCLRIGKGQLERIGTKASADTVEAILGAIYLDSGQDDLKWARSFVYRHVLPSELQPKVDADAVTVDSARLR